MDVVLPPLPLIGPGVRQYRGDAGVLVGLILDDGAGNVLNLSGHTLKAQWRPSEDSRTVIDLDLSASTLASGVVIVKVAAEDSMLIQGDGIYDVEVTFGSAVSPYSTGDRVTLYREPTSFTKDVTR